MSDMQKTAEEIFFQTTGFTFSEPLFYFYVLAGSDEETLEYIAESSNSYPDPEKAELGFIAVWRYFKENWAN